VLEASVSGLYAWKKRSQSAREQEDGEQNAGSKKGNDDTDDQATGASDPQETGQTSSNQAHDYITDHPIAFPTHHPAGEKAGNQPNQKPPEDI